MTAAATATVSRFSMAQAYPARPLRLVVGFAAGGNFEPVARLIAQSLSKELSQPIAVENGPGASGNLATEAVLRSEADGYTLLLCGAVNAINATLYQNLTFDLSKKSHRSLDWLISQCHDSERIVSREDGLRVYRLREGQSGTGQSRFLRHRDHATPCGRAVQDDDRDKFRSRPRSVARRRPSRISLGGRSRFCSRPCRLRSST